MYLCLTSCLLVLLCAEVMRCAPASARKRSLAYLLQRPLDCWSCDGVDTEHSGASGSLHFD